MMLKQPKITLVVAKANNDAIGVANKLPWHIPEDFAFFKAYTSNKPIVMGRKTWESLPQKPLPNRLNIVISRNKNYIAKGATVVSSLITAIKLCDNLAEICIIGGAEIYRQAIEFATDLMVTEVDLVVPNADSFFVPIDKEQWQQLSSEHYVSKKGIAFNLVHYKHNAR